MSESRHAPAMGAEDDLAPGEERLDGSGVAHGVRGYLIGLVFAAGLTAASFYLCFSGLIYAPAIPAALVALAVAQMGVHLVFFLHLTTGPDNTNNALALAFGVLIVTLVIGGSLWIMANLNHSMLPMARVMEMQR
jgi:cytochrome o ubiquinol oxidase operon protein cyoD